LEFISNRFKAVQENSSGDIADLAAAVRRAHERQYDIGNKLKKVKRRSGTLTEHLAQYENLKAHKTAEKHALHAEFYKLWDDVRNVEVLRRSAERIMGGQTRERTVLSSKHDHSL
jgi:hypothetical protein